MSKRSFILQWTSIDEELPDSITMDCVIAFVPEKGMVVVCPGEPDIWETIKVENCNTWSGVSRLTFNRGKQKKCLPLATHWMPTPSDPV